MRLLVLVTDAYGGRGGIAKFNRDLLESLCANEACAEIVAVPRIITDAIGELPSELRFDQRASAGKFMYVRRLLELARRGSFDGVICGHVNLTALAWLVARALNVPLLLVTHGVEAWRPTPSMLARTAVRHVDAVVSVSEFTKQRLIEWSGLRPEVVRVVPNCVDVSRFGPGERRRDLVARYSIEGRTVLLTVGRLAGAERYKGFDEVMELLPSLSRDIPTVSYLVVGDGQDRGRLERKAGMLGIADRVIFAGHVPEQEKADHYRLADAFVMPSRGEGFGIVYLEAMACGVPVVASIADASREAVLDGAIGEIAAPDRPEEIRSAILRALARERRVAPELDHFSVANFRARWDAVIGEVFAS